MLGIDIVNVKAVERIYRKHGRLFLREILDPAEIKSLPRAANRQFFRILSGYIAAKEAVFKACPVLELDWKEISVGDLTTRPHIRIKRPGFHGNVFLSCTINGAMAVSQALSIERSE